MVLEKRNFHLCIQDSHLEKFALINLLNRSQISHMCMLLCSKKCFREEDCALHLQEDLPSISMTISIIILLVSSSFEQVPLLLELKKQANDKKNFWVIEFLDTSQRFRLLKHGSSSLVQLFSVLYEFLSSVNSSTDYCCYYYSPMFLIIVSPMCNFLLSPVQQAVLFKYCKHDTDLLSGAPSHESTKIMKWLSRLLLSKDVRA